MYARTYPQTAQNMVWRVLTNNEWRDKSNIIIGQKLGRVDDKAWPKLTQGHKNNAPEKNLWSDLVLCKKCYSFSFFAGIKEHFAAWTSDSLFIFKREFFALVPFSTTIWYNTTLSDWTTHQFGLDEVTDHLVVEVLDGRPFDSLLNVLLLQRRNTVRFRKIFFILKHFWWQRKQTAADSHRDVDTYVK